MDILSLVKIVIRRWLVVLPVIAIVVATGYNAMSSIKTVYQANADVLLIAPVQSFDAKGNKITSNPIVDFRGSLNTTGIIITTIVTDGDHHQALADQHLSTDFNVTVNATAPIVSVSAKSGDPTIARNTVAAVVNSLSAEMKKSQDTLDVAADNRVSASLLTASGAYPLSGSRSRVAAAVGAVGLAAIIGAALLAESFASARVRRREERQQRRAAELTPLPVYDPPAPEAPPAAAVDEWEQVTSVSETVFAEPADNGGSNGTNHGADHGVDAPPTVPPTFPMPSADAAIARAFAAPIPEPAPDMPRHKGLTRKARAPRRPVRPVQPPAPDL